MANGDKSRHNRDMRRNEHASGRQSVSQALFHVAKHYEALSDDDDGEFDSQLDSLGKKGPDRRGYKIA